MSIPTRPLSQEASAFEEILPSGRGFVSVTDNSRRTQRVLCGRLLEQLRTQFSLDSN